MSINEALDYAERFDLMIMRSHTECWTPSDFRSELLILNREFLEEAERIDRMFEAEHRYQMAYTDGVDSNWE